MNPMQIFFILWFWVLPILGITTPTLALIVWFFIIPKIAKMLTWARFKNVSIHAIADDSGYVELVPTKVELAEGVVKTKRGWRILPRPIWKKTNKGRGKQTPITDQEIAERLALKKYVLRDLGKPFWFGYAGLCAAVNPATLAILQQNPISSSNPDIHFNEIRTYVETLPEQFMWNNQTIHIRKDLTEKLNKLHEGIKVTPLKYIDPRAIKEILPELTPPSLMDAIEAYGELVGLKEGGKKHTTLIIGGAILAIILILGIVAIMSM